MRGLVATAALAVVVLSACSVTGSSSPTQPETTVTSTVVHTRTVAPTFKPTPATSVTPLPPGQAPGKGEVERACPYIASTPTDNPDVNVADIEGDHVYRTTVLTTMKPVGCRFYFYAGPYEAIADITTQAFATAGEAHDAMVLTGNAGHQAQGVKNLVPGVDAVLFKSTFFGPDGPNDWACAFAKGKVLVIVHTQQSDVSFNARSLAQAVAPKI